MNRNPYPSVGDPEMAETWFHALDQRRVVTPRDEWDILVTGVHTVGRDCWIQMSAAQDERKQVLLQVSEQTTVEAALEAVATAAREDLPVARANV
jgi:hypothetical protein